MCKTYLIYALHYAIIQMHIGVKFTYIIKYTYPTPNCFPDVN